MTNKEITTLAKKVLSRMKYFDDADLGVKELGAKYYKLAYVNPIHMKELDCLLQALKIEPKVKTHCKQCEKLEIESKQLEGAVANLHKAKAIEVDKFEELSDRLIGIANIAGYPIPTTLDEALGIIESKLW